MFTIHILITGSTRGIGFGLAEFFLKNGHKVTINGTSDQSVQNAINKLKEKYQVSMVQGVRCNITDIKEVEQLWDKAANDFGNIDIWINNAGVDQDRLNIWEIPNNQVLRVVNTNIVGVINCSTIAMKKMIDVGKGQIYNVEGYGSDGMVMKKMTLYGTSKCAVSYYTKSLAKEAEDTPILIGALSPGMVITDFLINSAKGDTQEAIRSRKVYNIFADDVNTVANFLGEGILSNKHNNARIVWLTKKKVIKKLIVSKLKKHDIFKVTHQ